MKADGPTVPKAPCQVACPAGTDAGRYVGLIGAGRYDEAYAVAAEVNPFPSVCGWICTAPCESACRRGVLDEPIAIRTLKRFAAEHGQLPAGRAARRQAAREGRHRRRRPGRHVRRVLPRPARLSGHGVRGDAGPGRDDGHRHPVVSAAARRPAGRDRPDRRASASTSGSTPRWAATSPSATSRSRAIARSSSRPAPRRAAGSGSRVTTRPAVVPATLFLKRVNLGEEPRLSGPAVVVGGGSTAMDAARSAWRSGASPVTVVYRRGRAEMPAQVEEIEAAEREGIVVRTGLAPVEVVRPRRRRRRPPLHRDARGDRRARRGDRRRRGSRSPAPSAELPAATILVAVGEEPDPSILPEGAGIEVSGWAGIVADPRTLATGRAGIFAGGDVVSGPKTIIDAVASGRRAAASIHEYLRGRRRRRGEPSSPRSATRPRPRADARRRPRDAGRGRTRRCRWSSRARSRRPRSASTRPTARAEADRCFRCDALYRGPIVDVRGRARPRRRPAPIPTRITDNQGTRRHRWRRAMTPDQVSGFFDAGEAFIEGTIAAALVVLWMLALALHLGRPLHGPDDRQVHPAARCRPVVDHLRRPARPHRRPGLPRQLHLLLPGRRRRPGPADHRRPCRGLRLRASCSSSSSATATRRAAFRWQLLLLGLGATLYIVPYLLGVQMTELHGKNVERLVPMLVSST